MSNTAALLLQKQLAGMFVVVVVCGSFVLFLYGELNRNPVEGFSAGLVDDADVFQWEVMVMGPEDTLL